MDKHVAWSGELYHDREEHTPVSISSSKLKINALDTTDPVQVAPGPGGTLWAVLMRESAFGPKRLEFYQRYSEYSSSRPACFVLDLSNMLHVERDLKATPANPTQLRAPWDLKNKGHSRRPTRPQQWHQFRISTGEKSYIFATRTGEQSSLWVGKLNELLHGPPEQGVECECVNLHLHE